MTAGGPTLPPNHGFAYVRDLASMFYGIPETVLFSAELPDVEGASVEKALRDAEGESDAFMTDQQADRVLQARNPTGDRQDI